MLFAPFIGKWLKEKIGKLFFHTRENMFADCHLTNFWRFWGLFYFYFTLPELSLLFLIATIFISESQIELVLFSHASIRPINKFISDRKKQSCCYRESKENEHCVAISIVHSILRIFRFCIICGIFLKFVFSQVKGLSLLGFNSVGTMKILLFLRIWCYIDVILFVLSPNKVFLI